MKTLLLLASAMLPALPASATPPTGTLTNVSASLSTHAAGVPVAVTVQYTLGTTLVAGQNVVRLTLPSGFVVQNANWSASCATAPVTLSLNGVPTSLGPTGINSGICLTYSGTSAQINVGTTIPAGTVVAFTLPAAYVTNPTTSGTKTFSQIITIQSSGAVIDTADTLPTVSINPRSVGSQNIGSTSANFDVIFDISSSTTFNATTPYRVLTTGTDASDFIANGNTCTGTISAGSTCTASFKFKPSKAGIRYGAVVLYDASGAPVATQYVYGTGTGPQIAFPNSTYANAVGSSAMAAGLATDQAGNLYIANPGTGTVLKETPSGASFTESAIASGLSEPIGVAVDGAGNVFVIDRAIGTLLKLTLSNTDTYTVSNVANGLGSLQGVAVDGSGIVYVTDLFSNNVLAFTPSGTTYTQSTVLSGLDSPAMIAADQLGNLFVVEAGARDVVKATLSGSAYNKATILTGLTTPAGIAIDAGGTLYIAERAHNDVLKATGSGTTYTATQYLTGIPLATSVAIDAQRNVYVSEGDPLGAVLKNDVVTPPTFTFGSTPAGTTSSDSPKTLTLQNLGNASLSFPIPGTGTNPSVSADFNLGSSSTCPQVTSSSSFAGSLAAGASCTALINFKPTTDGSISSSLVFTDNNLNASPAVTQSISLSGTATQSIGSFSISGPATGSAGVAQSITVTALDTAGSTFTGYTGTVHFTSSDAQASLPGNYTFTAADNGVHTFSVTLKTSGSQSVTASDTVVSTATGSTSSTIAAGSAVGLTLSGANPAPFYTSMQIIVMAVDVYGNTATTYNGTVTLSSSDPGAYNPGPVTLTNGSAFTTTGFKLAGTDSLTAVDTSNPSITGTTNFTVPPGAADHFTVSTPATSNSGQAISFSVTARDFVNNVATPYTGTVHFTSSDPTAVLPADYTFTVADSGTHTLTATLKAPGDRAITATDTVSAISGTSGTVAVSAPKLVVTTTADAAANAANCTAQSATGTGTDATCSLRDALAQAASLGAGNISFDHTVFASAKTINLTNGSLTIPAYTSIQGATSGSGSTLANLVTVAGPSTSSGYTVFTAGASANGSAISNLIVTKGYGTGSAPGCLQNDGNLTVTASTFTSCTGADGGAILNRGTLTLASSTITSSSASRGGAISNAGNLALTESTISGNTSLALSATGGGGIYNAGTAFIKSSTISNNSVLASVPFMPPMGGGIFLQSGTISMSNSIVAGNVLIGAGGAFADVFGALTDSGDNQVNTSPAPVSLLDVKLSALGNYGGPTATMVPMPGSPAICSASLTDIPNGVTTDQRGYARTTANGSTTCVDAGSVQSNFALAFTQQPSNVVQYAAMTPAPSVTLTENGIPVSFAVSIPLTLSGNGAMTGGSASTSAGVATYSSLKIDTAGTPDSLKANLTLNSLNGMMISATSDTFNVLSSVTQLIFGTAPATPVSLGGNAGSAITVKEAGSDGSTATSATDTITLTVTGPASYSKTYTAAAVNGVATFNLASVALNNAGTYTYKATFGSFQTSATEVVNKGAATVALGNLNATFDSNTHAATATTVPASLAVTFTYNGSATVPTAAGSYAVVATVNDANYQGSAAGTLTISKATSTITWAAPAAVTYGTPLSTTQLNATANVAGTFVYTPAAGTILPAGASQTLTANFTPTDAANYTTATKSVAITVNRQATSIALTSSATSVSPVQSITFTATVSPAANGSPTGTVTFLDGTTALQTVSLSGTTAAYTVTLTPGSHTISVSYSGDANYLSSATTTGTAVTVQPFEFNITSVGSNYQTVIPGGSANFTYSISPTYGVYPGPVVFSVTGLPTGATYSLSQSTISATSGQQQITLNIHTAVSTARNQAQKTPWVLAFLLLPFAGARKLRRGSRRMMHLSVFAFLLLAGLVTTGCGSGNGFLAQSPKDYAVTITATSGNIVHTSTVTLNVQ